ncbi:MAG: S9 family peptidase [Gemmatimonadetes bacterium]|nr:S9 family peptidase [Gemmatimonadota bacterium]
MGYFTLRREGDEVASIWRRPAPKEPTVIDPKGTYELVLDPRIIRADGTTSVSIDGFSTDGTRMLYSVRDGGPDEVTVKVRDLAKRADLPDSLPWALYASVEFDKNATGIYYVHRSRQTGPRFTYHRLGTDVAKDTVLFGDGLKPTAFLSVATVKDGALRIYTVGHGWARNDVYVQDVAKGGAPAVIAKDVAAHFAPQFVSGRILMRTDLDAPKGRIVSVDPSHPEQAQWKTIIPEGEDVIDAFSEIDGKLYVTYIHDVAHRVRAFATDGTAAGEIAVPPFSSVTLRGAGKGKALLTVTSFKQPPVTYRVDLATGERTIYEKSDVPFDSASVVVEQVWYPTKDGMRAPMYVMHKPGLRRTGDHPTLLTGYGGFALSLLPRFDALSAVWVEQGGVAVQATLRGGNEYGETWHKDGMLLNKQHVFDDFQSAMQALSDSGFTKPARLAIRGTSNGGLLMGSAITQRPDLFRAAFVGRPDLDILRFPWFPTANNAPALLEYGDASKPDEYAAIRKFSPYQNVTKGTKYPAVMLMQGQCDTRVPPWAARKFTAAMQAATTSGLPVILFYDMRSGHAGGTTASGNIATNSRQLDFLLRMVGDSAR